MVKRTNAGLIPPRAGFTLIELLVAMSMLVVIVLIVSMLFQRASAVWGTGENKVETLMTGRTVADFIAQEMQMALPTGFVVNATSVEFYKLVDAYVESPKDVRAMRYIKFDFGSGTLNYHLTTSAGTSVEPVCEGLVDVEFTEERIPGDALPLWVDIVVTVTNSVGRKQKFQTRVSFPFSREG